MSIDDNIVRRILMLLDQAPSLTGGNEHGQVRSEGHRQQCAGWLTSAQNIVQRLCRSPDDAYRAQLDKILARGAHLCAHDQVGEVAAILRSLLSDAQDGLLSSLADRARAETFDDFLDHAADYHKQHRKSESGVIVGVVFEDAVRRAYRKHVGADKAIQLDELISALVRSGILTESKAKRARAAAHVRTKATHAQWDEFDLSDVGSAIEFTRQFISEVIDG